ncbi:6-hydroxy-D-nicotine oxidase [Tolypocladium ophioglossoides CBS 100239]|uniref:6-hydroxy-D-nicotine oxidase n=1 Tax=Tolypocladium ophioglossoides (strain CBS 100239) TaxID=1163406 RepID=A0A0L0MYT2_TOLOC|nr:6-hydroxy-D-nicotine oxidase [Tolypocladium ophioglossoides CBS 100239]
MLIVVSRRFRAPLILLAVFLALLPFLYQFRSLTPGGDAFIRRPPVPIAPTSLPPDPDFPDDYLVDSPESPWCQERFGRRYLEDARNFSASYCTEESASRFTCFSSVTAAEDPPRVDNMCYGHRAVFDAGLRRFRLACDLRTLTPEEIASGVPIVPDDLSQYWYETGPRAVMGEAVLLDGSARVQGSQRTTILVKREGSGNVWHALMEVMSLTWSLDVLQISIDTQTGEPFVSPKAAETTQVVLLDPHNDGAFMDLWKLFAKMPVRRIHELNASEPVSDIIIPFSGGSNTLWQGDWVDLLCRDSALVKTFVSRVLAHYDVATPARDGKEVIVTYIQRTNTRKLIDEAGHMEALRKQVPHMKLNVVDFALLSFRQQLKVVRETDLLVGVHGAGLTHLMFLPPGSAVIEILPEGFQHKGFRNLAQMLGIGFFRAHTKMHGDDSGDNQWQFNAVEIDQQKLVSLVGHGKLRLYQRLRRLYPSISPVASYLIIGTGQESTSQLAVEPNAEQGEVVAEWDLNNGHGSLKPCDQASVIMRCVCESVITLGLLYGGHVFYFWGGLNTCVAMAFYSNLEMPSLLSIKGLLASLTAIGGPASSQNCKAYPGSEGWPSTETWNRLNSTLGGQLLSPAPPAAVCHQGQLTYDAEKCIKLGIDWSSFEYHASNPVSVMWEQFTNDTCLPDPQFPCTSSGYPPFVVNSTTPEHVQTAINFARENNVRLVVKSTGHDDIGRSIAPGALSIWTHHMNKIVYHAGEFKLAGSGKLIAGNAVTVGGGTQMYDIYAATAEHGQTIVGGGGKSVGISGYLTGGGHSILASRYGLAADNVLEMEIVTPGGDVITINEDQHADLFWAMRGGGGSTFGVITSVTLKTYPSPKIAFTMWFATTAVDSPVAFDVVAYVVSQFPDLMDKGVSGYQYLVSTSPNPNPGEGEPNEVAGVMGGFMMQDAEDGAALEKLLKPLNDTIQERWPRTVRVLQQTALYGSFLDWFNVNFDQGVAGLNLHRASRLVDREALTGDPHALAKAYKSAADAGGAVTAYMVAGKGVRDAKPRGGGNAVNPAWRRAYIQSLTGVPFPPFNKTAENNALKALGDAFEPLRKLTPGMGSYINEVWMAPRERLANDILGQSLSAAAQDQERGRSRGHTVVLPMRRK